MSSGALAGEDPKEVQKLLDIYTANFGRMHGTEDERRENGGAYHEGSSWFEGQTLKGGVQIEDDRSWGNVQKTQK